MNKYKTQQRQMIQNFLQQQDYPVTAQQIVDYLNKEQQKVSLATIYRNLQVLIDAGKIRLSTSSKSGKQYEWISDDCHHHLHLKCQICQKVIHYHSEKLNSIHHLIEEETGFKMDFGNSIYVGICEECQKGNIYAAN